MSPFAVKIAIVEPGYFRTGMTNVQDNLECLEQQWVKVPKEVRDTYGQTYYDSSESFDYVEMSYIALFSREKA